MTTVSARISSWILDVSWAWQPMSIHIAIRTSRRSLVGSLRTVGDGFELPMHADANYASNRPIRSLWIMLQRPPEGGELIVDGCVKGRSRIKLFDGRDPHGVTRVCRGSRTVLLIQHYHKL